MYRPTSGTLTAKRDVVGVECQSHSRVESSLGPQDGTIIILELGYFPAGAKTVTFAGTTACGGGRQASGKAVQRLIQRRSLQLGSQF